MSDIFSKIFNTQTYALGDPEDTGGMLSNSDWGGEDNSGKKPGEKDDDGKWKSFKDIRKHQDAGKYPNQPLCFKSRSGHSIMIDDTKGKESFSIQHRGGSAAQLLPNGAIHIVANHGKTEAVMGRH